MTCLPLLCTAKDIADCRRIVALRQNVGSGLLIQLKRDAHNLDGDMIFRAAVKSLTARAK
jgi:hypothetical protein